MQEPDVSRAVAAATWIASALGLSADDAIIVQNSNKLALRLLPCDVLARVAPEDDQNAQLEIDLSRQLDKAGSPVAVLDPRVEPRTYERDGFVVTLWSYYESVTQEEIPAVDYAEALRRLHAGMRQVDYPTPHFMDRVGEARHLLANPQLTPALGEAERELLEDTLRDSSLEIARRDAAEQLLHGEPHPGNLLATKNGPLFIDFETCCRGPVEFDLAHAPAEIAEHYPGIDQELLRHCRILMLAIIITWRWDKDDQLPGGLQLAHQWLGELRTALDSDALDPRS